PHETTGEQRSLGRRGRESPGSQETCLRPKATYPSRKGRLIHMNTRNGALAVLAAAVACAAPATNAAAAPTTVNVRIEGKTKTIFEGPVTPAIQTVDGNDGKGPQTCDGTNGG